MDAYNVPRKRQRDDFELRANTSQGTEGVNKNLLKCLVVLTKHIIDVHNSENDVVRYDTNTVIKAENDDSCDIDITEHNIAREPAKQIPGDDNLSKNISLLKEQTVALEKIYNKPKDNNNSSNSCGLSESFNQTNYKTIDNSLRACVVQHLSEHSVNLTEQICNLISMYKSQQTEENARNIRKCLSKIKKKIKSIPFQTDTSESAYDSSSMFFPTINKPNLSTKESAYLSAAHNLSDKLTVLIKKVSKLKKVYKKRVLHTSVCEPAVKKPKLMNISNSVNINNNDNTFDNSVLINFTNDLENHCSTPKKVKKSQQITNIDDLNEISIVTNEKTPRKSRKSLDKTILEPDNSQYLNSELDPYTNNEKTKRKSKDKSENSSKNSIVVEAIVHNENTDDVTPKKRRKKLKNRIANNEDVVIEIESDNNSADIIPEPVPQKKRKKKRNDDGNISDNTLNDIVHSICADLVQENESALAAEQNNDNEVTCERQLKKKRKKHKIITENLEENAVIIEPNDETEKIVKRKKKKKKNSTNLEEESSEIIKEINGNDSPSKNLHKKKIKNSDNCTKNIQALVSENNEKEKNKKKKRRIKSVEYIQDSSSESDTKISVKNNNNQILSTEIHKEHKKTTICDAVSFENNGNDSGINNEPRRKKKDKKKSTEAVNEDTNNKLNINETAAEESSKKKVKKKKKSVENSNENSSENLVENNEIKLRKKHEKKKIEIESISENTQEILVQKNETTVKKKHKKKSTECISENSLEISQEILVENNETNGNVNNEITVKKKHKKRNKSREHNDVKPSENMKNVSVKIEHHENRNNDIIPKRERKRNKESVDKENVPLLERISEIIDKENVPILERMRKNTDRENVSILERMRKSSDKENVPILERIKENIDKESVPILERMRANIDKENVSILERIKENIDEENVPILERMREKLDVKRNSRSLLENSASNNEIFDFSSVLKIELSEDENEQDVNVNFVPWNSFLQDEALDEREQYLYLREMVETAKEKMDLTEETKDRLRGLCVLLDFEVPNAHKIENRLCVGPTKEQAERLAALGVKTGPLTRDEDEKIRRNWELFCKLHDLPNDPTPFLALQHGQDKYIPFEERRRFVQFLGKDLAHRPLHSIYRRFKVLYKVTKNGRFSQDEDMLILSYVKFSGHNAKFADLMPVLNRSRGAIEARYRALKKGITEKVSWDLELKAQLLQHMMTVMSVQNVKELQHADITHAHLSEVAKRMNMPVVKIRHQWCTKLYTQLFATNPLYLDQMKVDLVERLYELKIDDWRKVDWCEVAKTFPGVSPVSLRVLMKTLFRYNCPKKMQADLGAIVTHCRLIVMPELKKRPEFNQRYIFRLKLQKDGSLKEYI